MRELAEREAVTHRQRARADEALPACTQSQTFDRASGGIRTIEDPDALAERGSFLEHIAQRRDEGVDAATDVLQIDQQHVERIHHLCRRAANFAVEAEKWNAVHRIVERRRLDHVVLLVAAQAVLRAEGGGQREVVESRERVERMREVGGDRCGMSEQRESLAAQRAAQRGLAEQAIDAELHSSSPARGSFNTKPVSLWKSGLPGLCFKAQ